MTNIDRKAYNDWMEMSAYRDGGFGVGEIAEIMGVSVSYLLSLEDYFD